MAPAELAVDGVAGIGIPDEAHDLHEHAAVSSQPGIARLQERKSGTAHMRVVRAEQSIDMRFRQRAVLDHGVTRCRISLRSMRATESRRPADREATRQR